MEPTKTQQKINIISQREWKQITLKLFCCFCFSASANAQLRPVNQLNNRIDSLKRPLLKKDSLKNEELAQKKLDRLYKLEKDYKNKPFQKKYQMKVIRLLSDLRTKMRLKQKSW